MFKNTLLLLFAQLCVTVLFAQNETCIDCSLIDPYAICTTEYDPVCGCDGVTYSNACVAEVSAGVVYFEAGECPENNVSDCSDLDGLDFGPCDQVLGIGIIDGQCVTISGCSTVAYDGVDYGDALFTDEEACLQSCLCGGPNAIDDQVLRQIQIQVDSDNALILIQHPHQRAVPIHIVDMTGRTVMEENVSTGETMDISSLKNGAYLINLVSENGAIHSQRLQLNR